MYDFHKIKSMKNHQEFKHPLFNKYRFQDLNLIRRKKVLPIAVSTEKAEKTDNQAIEKLKAELNNIQQQFKLSKTQNINLSKTNKDMMNQLYRLKNVIESKMKKILYMLFVMMNQFDNALTNILEVPLKAIGIWIDDLDKNMNKGIVLQIFNKINDLLASSTPYSITIVDQLLDCFYKYYNEKNPNFNIPEVDWKQLFDVVLYKKVINPVFHDFTPSILSSPSHFNIRLKEIFVTNIRNSKHASINEEKLRSEQNLIFKKNLIDFDNFDLNIATKSLLDSPTLPYFTIAPIGQQSRHPKWTDDAGLYYKKL